MLRHVSPGSNPKTHCVEMVSRFRDFDHGLGPWADVLLGGIPDSIESLSNQIQGLLEDPLSCLWLPGMVWAMNIWMPSRFSFACLVFCHGCVFLPKKIPWDIGMRHSPWDWKDHHQKPAGRDHFVLSSTGSILNLTEPIDPRVLGWWTHDLMVAPQVDLIIAHRVCASFRIPSVSNPPVIFFHSLLKTVWCVEQS